MFSAIASRTTYLRGTGRFTPLPLPRGKSFDTHASIGLWIITADDAAILALRYDANGDLRQEDSMIALARARSEPKANPSFKRNRLAGRHWRRRAALVDT